MTKPKSKFIGCSGPKRLRYDLMLSSAARAIEENPANRPSNAAIASAISAVITAFSLPGAVRIEGAANEVKNAQEEMIKAAIAAITTKYWKGGEVKHAVYFIGSWSSELKQKTLHFANLWEGSGRAKIRFVETLTRSNAHVRLARAADGHWSYLGQDTRSIPQGEPTMNLHSWSMQYPDSEYHRVVTHEFGHYLGFPHEHMRPAIIQRLDPQKTIDYFGRTQGWSPSEVRAQVLTPLPEGSLTSTPTDETSIMSYQLPGEITKDGRPIPGGASINQQDLSLAARLWPGDAGPVGPGEPDPGDGDDDDEATYRLKGNVVVTAATMLPGAWKLSQNAEGKLTVGGNLDMTGGLFTGTVTQISGARRRRAL